MADNLFADQSELPILDDNKDYLVELVGEGKKFTDAKALAKSKVASDIAILQRERENKALRDEMTNIRQELASRSSMEELIEKLNKRPDESNSGNQPNETAAGSLNPTQIEEIVEQKLKAKQEQSASDANFNEVQNGLVKAFGQNYPDKLKAKAAELGLGESFLNNLARQSPKAFFSVLGVETVSAQPQSVFTPKTQISFSPNPPQVKNKKYYDNLKKTMKPEEFWSGKVQNEMYQQAATLGDSFYE